MRTSIKLEKNHNSRNIRAAPLAALCVLCCAAAHSADKYSTYGALSIFGASQSLSLCEPAGGLASVRLAVRDSDEYLPSGLSISDAPNSVRFTFNVVPNVSGGFMPAPPLRPLSLEAWRTFTEFGAGTWNFVSIQKLSNGERLSDAIKHAADTFQRGCGSPNIKAVEVISGDMQVSALGNGFTTSGITVAVKTQFPETAAIGASTVLASEAIFDEALDTGIDGPKTAVLTDSAGSASFALTAGSRSGVKRFVVKARTPAVSYAASAMVTLIHAPVGAPVTNSVPIVEYRYEGGSGARPRVLTGSAAVTRALDSRDEANVFTRTGQVWRAFTDVNAAPGLAPVCQFFGRVAGSEAVSHFYTANVRECSALRALWGDAGSAGPGLKYEGVAFYAVVPDAQGRCPSAFPIEIRRYFETRGAPHHVYLVIDSTPRPLTAYRPSGTSEGAAFCTDVATAF
jgi:hypothetical protein